jgi:cell division protein FtsA
MPKDRYIVGIDIGTHAVRVVQVKMDAESGQLAVIGAVSVPSSGLRRGVVVDLDEAVSSLSTALEKVERMTAVPVSSGVVAVGGSHIASLTSKGVIAVSKADGEVSEADIVRVIDAAQAVSIPPNREVIHVIPKAFVLDSQEGIKDPLGMTGVRLEVDTTIVHAGGPLVKNVQRVCAQAGVEVEELVVAPLAASQATLNRKQKELGVVLVDIGAGTTSIAVYEESTLLHTAVLPLGGLHITNDLAIGLRTSIETAERVKVLYGHADKRAIDGHQVIDLSKIDETEDQQVPRAEVVDIVEARLEEIFEHVSNQLRAINRDGKLPAGVVLVGGTSNLPGIVEYAKAALRLPTQLGTLQGLQTIIDKVEDPSFAAACGLALWSSSYASSGGAGRLLDNPNVLKLKRWFKSFLP